MSQRQITDCDGCSKKDIQESFRLEVNVPGAGKQRIDLEIKCAGKALQTFVNALPDAERKAWIEGFIGKIQTLTPQNSGTKTLEGVDVGKDTGETLGDLASAAVGKTVIKSAHGGNLTIKE